ncbi:hypothetical protein ACG83_32925 [Frankia sp. R43]|uniref:hypothetical protein n=1 Tax=Frankia sp. R43 TaxID=269536 RepID=UPI0006CA2727|nr:hypothetical protein [Frankia sp. R43]KPM51651.1 hypothetical protein ACG83_32925 [Frankia sp. R43]
MTNRAQILLNSLARSAVGLTALTRPVPIIRLAGVDRVTAEKIAWIARLAGIRDLALGLGLLHAHTTGGKTQPWLVAGLLSDTADTAVLAHATAHHHLPAAYGTVMTLAAGGGAALATTTLTTERDHHHTQEQTGQPPR